MNNQSMVQAENATLEQKQALTGSVSQTQEREPITPRLKKKIRDDGKASFYIETYPPKEELPEGEYSKKFFLDTDVIQAVPLVKKQRLVFLQDKKEVFKSNEFDYGGEVVLMDYSGEEAREIFRLDHFRSKWDVKNFYPEFFDGIKTKTVFYLFFPKVNYIESDNEAIKNFFIENSISYELGDKEIDGFIAKIEVDRGATKDAMEVWDNLLKRNEDKSKETNFLPQVFEYFEFKTKKEKVRDKSEFYPSLSISKGDSVSDEALGDLDSMAVFVGSALQKKAQQAKQEQARKKVDDDREPQIAESKEVGKPSIEIDINELPF